LSEARDATGRNNSVVNGYAGCSTNVADEAGCPPIDGAGLPATCYAPACL